MANVSFFKSNLYKVILFILSFAVLLLTGFWLFNKGLLFTRNTMFLRMSFMVIAVIWSLGSILWVSYKFEFLKYWRGLVEDLWGHQEDGERSLYREYQELMNLYPRAVADYEQVCWRKKPRPTSIEVMEGALGIGDEEWKEREKAAVAKMAEKRNR